ncbi:2-dehydropantoate 2-reductase [Propionibacterium cyclohexanicum]|uniref:2-dehydropantoate 2-reductase n=1 Tax=Propionibacterium cyclohexanicum TaxID=64702 RepID=A0A1H9QRG4_9ACTN|nr:2-dehydropantoate 2-reductase [Propionibacterium cyclohexanicum]SER62429.1 2-dehydropantoate 2-reductase [Propionibacterium cyclohexanicum]
MRIAIIGAGAIGGFFGAKLVACGQDVHFVARGRTLDVLRSQGLTLVSGARRQVIPVHAAEDSSDIGPVDIVLCCVKATQVIDALEPAGALIGSGTGVVTTQNGVDGPRLTASVVGREHTLPGVVKVFAQALEPGLVSHVGGPGSLEVGEWHNEPTARIAALRAALIAAQIPSPAPRDVWELLWEKSMIVVPAGGLGALSGVPIGELLSRPGLRRVLVSAIREIREIAAARGVSMADEVVERTMAFIESEPPAATTSLQRDLMAGRPSELDPQLGAVVRYGRDAGVPTPLHELMYEVLKLGRGRQGPVGLAG